MIGRFRDNYVAFSERLDDYEELGGDVEAYLSIYRDSAAAFGKTDESLIVELRDGPEHYRSAREKLLVLLFHWQPEEESNNSESVYQGNWELIGPLLLELNRLKKLSRTDLKVSFVKDLAVKSICLVSLALARCLTDKSRKVWEGWADFHYFRIR